MSGHRQEIAAGEPSAGSIPRFVIVEVDISRPSAQFEWIEGMGQDATSTVEWPRIVVISLSEGEFYGGATICNRYITLIDPYSSNSRKHAYLTCNIGINLLEFDGDVLLPQTHRCCDLVIDEDVTKFWINRILSNSI